MFRTTIIQHKKIPFPKSGFFSLTRKSNLNHALNLKTSSQLSSLARLPLYKQTQARRNNSAHQSGKAYTKFRGQKKFWFSGYVTTAFALSLFGWMSGSNEEEKTEPQVTEKSTNETETETEMESDKPTKLSDILKNRSPNSPLLETWDLEAYLINNVTAQQALDFIKSQHQQALRQYGKNNTKTWNARLSELELRLLMNSPSEVIRELTEEQAFAEDNFGPKTPQNARALVTLAKAYLQIGDPEGTAKCLKKAYDHMIDNKEDSPFYPQILDMWGNLMEMANQFENSEQFFNKELQFAQDAKDDKLVANANFSLGRLFLEMDDYDKADKHLNEAASIYYKLKRPMDIHKTNEVIALMQVRKEESDESALDRAEKLMTNAVEWNLRTFGQNAPRVWSLEDKFGQFLFDRRKPKEAEKHWKKAVEGLQRIFTNEPIFTISPLVHLAQMYLYEGQYLDAEKSFGKLVTIFQSEVPKKRHLTPALAQMLHLRGICLISSSESNKKKTKEEIARFKEGFQCVEHSVEILQDFDPESLELARYLVTYAKLIAEETPKNPLAKELSTRAVQIFEKAGYGESDPQYIAAVLENASLLQSCDDDDAAEAAYRRVFKTCVKEHGFGSEITMNVVTRYSAFLNERKRSKDAEALLHETLKKLNPVDKNYDRFAGTLNYLLARSHVLNRNFKDASISLRRALDTFEKGFGTGHPISIEVRIMLAQVYVELKDHPRAFRLIKDLETYYVQSGEPVPEPIKEIMSNFASQPFSS